MLEKKSLQDKNTFRSPTAAGTRTLFTVTKLVSIRGELGMFARKGMYALLFRVETAVKVDTPVLLSVCTNVSLQGLSVRRSLGPGCPDLGNGTDICFKAARMGGHMSSFLTLRVMLNMASVIF